jgi:hypothetical protein
VMVTSHRLGDLVMPVAFKLSGLLICADRQP